MATDLYSKLMELAEEQKSNIPYAPLEEKSQVIDIVIGIYESAAKLNPQAKQKIEHAKTEKGYIDACRQFFDGKQEILELMASNGRQKYIEGLEYSTYKMPFLEWISSKIDCVLKASKRCPEQYLLADPSLYLEFEKCVKELSDRHDTIKQVLYITGKFISPKNLNSR
jgi:hypothetical protein